MPVIASPLIYRLRNRAGFSRSIEEIASEIVVLAPEEARARQYAISLPAQLERVRAVPPDTTLDFEHVRLSAGEVTHAPTRALLIRKACYLGGTLYAGGARLSQVAGKEALISFGHMPRIARAALPSSWVGSKYFGHHIVDDSATSLLAAEFGPVFRAPAPETEKWVHAPIYRRRFGVDMPILDKALVDEAWVFEDWGMNAHRRARLTTLRDRLCDGPSLRNGHGVFLRRRGGAGAPRNLINEEEIEQRLSGLGFEIIDPSKDTAESIISRCRNAAIVAGVEGSAFAHGFLGCAPNATFVILQHPYRFNNVWKDFTDALGMRYAYVVGEGDKNAFRIDPDEICATLDLL